jgi:hypothetical protein
MRVVLLPKHGDSDWGLRIRHGFQFSSSFLGRPPFKYETEVRGPQAASLIRPILPIVNSAGARDTEVKDALRFLDKYPTSTALFNHAAGIAARTGWQSDDDRGELVNLSPEHRLALEMVANEETERRALEGELVLLEVAWREAEEIAAISDNLLLPKGITERFAALVRRRSGP